MRREIKVTVTDTSFQEALLLPAHSAPTVHSAGRAHPAGLQSVLCMLSLQMWVQCTTVFRGLLPGALASGKSNILTVGS